MRKVLFRSLLLTAIVAAVFCFYYALPDVNVLKKKNPKSSALMELRDQEYKQKDKSLKSTSTSSSGDAMSTGPKRLPAFTSASPRLTSTRSKRQRSPPYSPARGVPANETFYTEEISSWTGWRESAI